MRSQALPTGFNPLDAMLDGGLHPHDLTLLAGKPSVGKTIATLQWARHVAATGGHVAYISYEHSEQSLMSRLLNLQLSETPAYADETALETMRRRIKADPGSRSYTDAALVGLLHRECEPPPAPGGKGVRG